MFTYLFTCLLTYSFFYVIYTIIPGWGRSPGEGNGYLLQYTCLEISMDRSLAGYSPWGRKESDTTEQLTLSLSIITMPDTCPNLHPTIPSIMLQCIHYPDFTTTCSCIWLQLDALLTSSEISRSNFQ